MTWSDDRGPSETTAPPFRNLQAYVLEHLGRRIVAGEVTPGDALPTEPQLAEEFGVSKTVIREAIRGLAAKGLLSARPRLGTRVRDREDWHMLDPDVLSWELRAAPADVLLRDFDEFRSVIEPTAARLAATRATDAQKRQLRAAYLEMADAVEDPERYFDADLDLHARLLAASGNKLLEGQRDVVRSALRLRHSAVATILQDMRSSLPLHGDVVEAIETGDPDAAARAMEALLLLSRGDEEPLRNPRRPA